MRGDAHNILIAMGFKPVEPGSCIYTSIHLGPTEFDFSNRQTADAIAAAIWDAGAAWGLEEAIKMVKKNIFQGI